MHQPTFFLTTYGCQMNKNDSERMAGLLASLGFVETQEESTADLILVNTCSVRQSAEDRVFGSQEKYLEYKKRKPDMIVAVTGCMPGRDKRREFKQRLPATDLYFPTSEMVHLHRWIAELRPDVVNSTSIADDYLKIHPLRAPSRQAYVTIQTGCNKFCAYCVVPYARGLERNRLLKDVLDECRKLAEEGVRDITLLGQTVNSFVASDSEGFSRENPFRPTRSVHTVCGENHFAALLWEANHIPGIERIHWTAPHPLSMTEDVIEALKLPKQVNYLHLPVQSGSNEVLKRMNRKYTRERYLEVIQKVKQARPMIALGTDIIVGFSGETRLQFEETLSLYREVEFDISYHAQYSVRSGTLGAKLFADDVSKEEKRERWDELQACMEEIAFKKNQAYKNKEVRVFVEKIEQGIGSGTNEEMKPVQFPLQDQSFIGQFVVVKVLEPQTWILKGEKVT